MLQQHILYVSVGNLGADGPMSDGQKGRGRVAAAGGIRVNGGAELRQHGRPVVLELLAELFDLR